jgi:glycosyltransferase involved in cell wall biosynthesis
LVAGSGDERYIAELKLLAYELKISENIQWCGWMSGEEKFGFLESLELFALTSYNENFAIVVTEALGMGTPVLLSENVGLADYVKETALGWVCRNEISSIRDTLKCIYQNRHRLEEIRRVAPTVIKKDFDKENLALKYIAAYDEMILMKQRAVKLTEKGL